MHSGIRLGEAIREAIELKIASGAVASKADIARHFGIKAPSIHDWINRGSIAKEKLPELWRYFSDVVGMEHWGLSDIPSMQEHSGQTLADRLNQRMGELGLSQEKLAEMANVSQSAIHKLCTGKAKQSRKLIAIAAALSVTPEWLELGVPSQTDGERLKGRFDELKSTEGMSRAAFAVKHKIPGGDAMIYQHIVGLKPISMDAGMAYAKGFGCTLADISSRLAEEASKVAAANQFLSPAQNDALNLISTMTDDQAKLWLAIGRTIQGQ